MRTFISLCAIASLALLPACEEFDNFFGQDDEFSSFGYGQDADDGWWGGDFGSPIDAQNGELGGDYGDMDQPPSEADVSGWDDYGFARVEVMAYSDEGVRMAIVEVYGGLDQADLEPGTIRTFRADTGYYGDYDGADVMVTGCAGQEAYQWMYDDMADEVTIEVTEDPEDPGMRTYAFTADFRQYDWTTDSYGSTTTTLEGSFQARTDSGDMVAAP